ncbi:MAG TPA: RecX family transcriptional regulator [Sphingomicrobium sp.]|nr:RecX family transcriptional regulator [Sphingomicrobium sp.]
MTAAKPRRTRPPLDQGKLDELALRYVGRFATTRHKLREYLTRKVRERGWSGEREADVTAVADRLAALGYIDDAAFAVAKTRSLSGRGYGARRVRQSLHAAGVGEDDSADANALAEAERVEAALRFARRRRIGPFADKVTDRDEREKAIAAMIRAGHSFDLARAIAGLEPGGNFTLEELAEKR